MLSSRTDTANIGFKIPDTEGRGPKRQVCTCQYSEAIYRQSCGTVAVIMVLSRTTPHLRQEEGSTPTISESQLSLRHLCGPFSIYSRPIWPSTPCSHLLTCFEMISSFYYVHDYRCVMFLSGHRNHKTVENKIK